MPDAAKSLRYDLLKQTNAAYDAKRYQQLEDLYVGGWQIMQKAPEYLPKLPMEHDALYAARVRTTAYMPYFGQIVDQFVADLFTQPLAVTPQGDAKNPDTPGDFPNPDFYAAFAKDVDGEGTDVPGMAGDVLTTALKHRVAYLMVDAPEPGDAPPANRKAEEELGLGRCYVYEVSPAEVIDWELSVEQDRDGRSVSVFDWVILYRKECRRASPLARRERVTETFTVWTLDEATGAARWDQYAYTYTPKQDDPRDETPVPWVAGGATSFTRIPLLRFELPEGLWVGNKIGPPALEHWVRRSELVGAEKRSCVAIPWAALGPEIPAPGEASSAAAEDEHRGDDPVAQFQKTGFMKLGHEDSLNFAEPHGHAYEIIDKQVDHVREAMFAVNHQMAASVRPNATALGRSGLSKQKDQDKTDKVLGALGREVRAFWSLVYDTVSRARGEDVIWVASGVDNFETYDRAAVIQEAVSLGQVAIPSPTFRKEHAKRVATVLVPGLPPATVAQMSEEIDKGVDAEEEKRKAQLDLDMQTIQLGPQVPAGKGPPGGGAPAAKKPDPKDGED